MSTNLTPGQTAEIAGPKKAFPISKPSVAASMIRRSHKVLLVLGSQSIDIKTLDGDLVDSIIRISKTIPLDVAVTGHLIGECRKRGLVNSYSIPLMSVSERLRDPKWKGLNGKGTYDLAIFIGHPYYMAWLVLNSLKHFALHLTTMSLGASYQPNASWSTCSMPNEKWVDQFNELIEALEDA